MKVEVKNGTGYCDGLLLRYKAPNIPDGRHECEYDKKLGYWVLSEPAEKEQAEPTGAISVKTDPKILVKTISELRTRVINAEHSLSCRESDIAELKGQLAEKDIQIEKLTEGINENYAIAEQKDERVYEVEQQLAAKEQQIEGYLQLLKANGESFSALEVAKDQEIESLQDSCASLRERVNELTRRVEKQPSLVEHLRAKDTRIKQLEIDLSGLKQTHLNMVSEYEARIRELKSKILELKNTIVALAKKLVQP